MKLHNIFSNDNAQVTAGSIVAIVISDAGHTEIPKDTKTVLGVGPAPSNLIDQVTGSLSLL